MRSSSRGVGGRSARPITAWRRVPCGTRWITLVPAPWASIAAR